MNRLCSSAFLLSFFLFIQIAYIYNINLYVDSGDTGEYILPERYHSTLLPDNHNSDFSHSSFQSLTEYNYASAIAISELSDIEDNDENIGVICRKDVTSILPTTDIGSKISHVFISQLENKFLKRTNIPLVILLHSWKSFLF